MTRPSIVINFAISADGKISTVNRDPSQFTSAQDHKRLLEIRKRADALLVGRGTLEADNMSMTIPAEMQPQHQPLRCIASRSGKFNPDHRVFQTPGGALHLLVTEPAEVPEFGPLEALGATIHLCSLEEFLRILMVEHGVQTLLCEGGGTLVRSLASLEAIDEVHLTWAAHSLFGGEDAPTITGELSSHLPASIQFELTHFEPLENGECFLSYQRTPPDS